jgi:hypothetical protein
VRAINGAFVESSFPRAMGVRHGVKQNSRKKKMDKANTLDRDLWYYYRLQPHVSYPIPWLHKGGKRFRYNGHRIDSWEKQDLFYPEFVIRAGRSVETDPCFILTMNTETHIAVLQWLRRGTDCFVDINESSRDLVHVAIQLAKQKGAIRLELMDTSTIRCPEEIRLSDLSFLTTGKTWYESILPGFIPTNSEEIEEMRNKVRTNTWASVIENQPILAEKIDTGRIHIHSPGSATRVVARSKKEGKSCHIFSTYMTKLLQGNGIQSLYGTTWSLDLTKIWYVPS